MNAAPSLLQRARPLLGTVVSIQLRLDEAGAPQASKAMAAAFALVERLQQAMSAHSCGSDLARLAQARAGEAIAIDPHTVAVLRLAQVWSRVSRGAFDPLQAGLRLVRRGLRPGLGECAEAPAQLAELRFLDERTVEAAGPLPLDLGGIAKGYAVDQAVATLRAHGMRCGLVNAGGDLRAFGDRPWSIEVQHPVVRARSHRLLRLREGALASSVRMGNPEFVATRRRAARWQHSTVLARDCVTADALTKWALQEAEPGLILRQALRQAGARMWRT